MARGRKPLHVLPAGQDAKALEQGGNHQRILSCSVGRRVGHSYSAPNRRCDPTNLFTQTRAATTVAIWTGSTMRSINSPQSRRLPRTRWHASWARWGCSESARRLKLDGFRGTLYVEGHRGRFLTKTKKPMRDVSIRPADPRSSMRPSGGLEFPEHSVESCQSQGRDLRRVAAYTRR
jgi:hypothetical protein